MVKMALVLECHMALLGNLACYARVPYGTHGSERVKSHLQLSSSAVKDHSYNSLEIGIFCMSAGDGLTQVFLFLEL